MDDSNLYKAIQDSDEDAFTSLFDRYYEPLCIFSLQFSASNQQAEEIVSDIFLTLWNRRKSRKIKYVRAYLYTSVRNATLNMIKKNTNFSIIKEDTHLSSKEKSFESHLIYKEELEQVYRIINKMPTQRRIIFLLNRIDGLKYKEIAEILDISPFTVQNQMVLAIKFLHAQSVNNELIDKKK